MTPSVSAFESIVAAGTALTRDQAEELLADPDLVSVGMLGEQARKLSSVVGMFRLAPERPPDAAPNQPFSPAADCRY